jgi:hypothetical protein
MEEEVIKAVRCLYSAGSESGMRQEANKFLESFQNRLEAWQVALDFVTRSDVPSEIALFGGQTLKHKVLLAWFCMMMSIGNRLCRISCSVMKGLRWG